MKAIVATIIFSVAGIFVWTMRVSDYHTALPLGVFYTILTLNTFFSLQIFSRVIPPGDRVQNSIDAILFFVYLALAWHMTSNQWFVFFALTLFIIASAKYSLLQSDLENPRLLRRKRLWNWLGALGCAAALAGVLAGFETLSVWSLMASFTVTSTILLFVLPLYRLDEENH